MGLRSRQNLEATLTPRPSKRSIFSRYDLRMVHEEELPKHSWRVTLLRRGANRVSNLNETFSPVAFGSVPNFPLDDARLLWSCFGAFLAVLERLEGESVPSFAQESSSTTGLWRGRTFPQEAAGVASTVVSADDRLSPSRYISLT